MANFNKKNPFEWGKSIADKPEYISIPTQRNATYTEPAKEVFTGNAVTSFFGNGQAPTPQLMTVCGIECPDSEGCDDGTAGGDGQNDNNNGGDGQNNGQNNG